MKNTPTVLFDDAECKALLASHNKLQDMRPIPGRNTVFVTWADDKNYYNAYYTNMPGDSGYIVFIMPKDKFTAQEAAEFLLDLKEDLYGDGLGDRSKEVIKILPIAKPRDN